MTIPVIPESIIERRYERQTDQNGNQIKPRDVNRSPNVTDRLEDFISKHNASLSDDSHERMLWFSDNLTNKQRQKRARSIIKDNLVRHLPAEWFDGSITFSKCQMEHGQELEVCIEAVANIPVMSVYAQAERNWAIRRLMEDIFANRRKTYLRKQKMNNADRVNVQPASRIGQDMSSSIMDENEAIKRNESVPSASPQTVPTDAKVSRVKTNSTEKVISNDGLTNHTPEISPNNTSAPTSLKQTEASHQKGPRMTEREAIIASSVAFQRIPDTPAPMHVSSDLQKRDGNGLRLDDFENENVEASQNEEEKILEIEKQIEALTSKKRRLEQNRDRVGAPEPLQQKISSNEIQIQQNNAKKRTRKTLGPKRRRDSR